MRAAAVGLGASLAATWVLRTVSTRVQRRFRDRVTIALEAHVARLQASVATLAHQERPDYLDRLAVLRNQVFVLDHLYMSLFSTCGWLLRLAVTIGLLVSIHPALALLAVAALPAVLTSTWRPAVERRRRRWRPRTPGWPAISSLRQRRPRRARRCGLPASGPASRRTGVGARVRADRGRAMGVRGVARSGLAGVRQRVRRRHRVRFGGTRRAGVAGAARARGRCPAVGVPGRDGRRDRLPPWHLDGRLAPPGVARELRGRLDGDGGATGPRRAARRNPSRALVVRLPRDLPTGARRRLADLAGRRGSRAGRRERGRQDDPREAAREAVRAHVGGHPRRRDAAGGHRSRPLAGAARGRVPGLLPLRVLRPADGRGRRRAAAGRRAGRGDRRRPGRRRGRGRASGVRARYAAQPDLAGGGGGVVRPVAEAGPRPRLHARRSAAARPRRAYRRPRRGNRARPVRALRRRHPPRVGRGRQRQRRHAPHHATGLPPFLDRTDGRPDRGARRGATRRVRHPRSATGCRRALRGTLSHPGYGLSSMAARPVRRSQAIGCRSAGAWSAGGRTRRGSC